MQDIADSRIIVTGSASGMGAAVMAGLVANGARVVGLDLSYGAGMASGNPAVARCDVSDKASVDAAFDAAVGHLGGLDTLIHAAGIAPGAPAESIAVDDWDQVFAVNARGTMLTNQAAFRHLRDAGGRIINFASGAGVSGLTNKAHYSATKGAVIAWTRTAAKEWGRYGITLNMIAPAISTPMYAKTRASMSADQLAALDARLAADMPIDGRLGDADRDLLPLMLFLSGDGARFITGQIFPVDGGLLMVR